MRSQILLNQAWTLPDGRRRDRRTTAPRSPVCIGDLSLSSQHARHLPNPHRSSFLGTSVGDQQFNHEYICICCCDSPISRQRNRTACSIVEYSAVCWAQLSFREAVCVRARACVCVCVPAKRRARGSSRLRLDAEQTDGASKAKDEANLVALRQCETSHGMQTRVRQGVIESSILRAPGCPRPLQR